jgi:proteasome lid subunit RPN8/RPN11
MSEGPDSEVGRWRAENLPLTIEYSRAIMERVRASVVEAFYKIGRGGVEVGGVLFGKHVGNLVQIQAFRPLPSEYLTGPSYVLSEKDQAALRRLLETSAEEPQLEGLVPVGWYHSHTRSGIHLSPDDLETYNRYFPEPWQVALVLKPERMKPVRAGFFIREPGSVIHAESSYAEFTVSPYQKKKDVVGRETKELWEYPEDLPPDGSVITHSPYKLWADWLVFTTALFLFLAGLSLLVFSYLHPPMKNSAPAHFDLPDIIRQRDALADEVEKLRGELERSKAETSRLEIELKKLEPKPNSNPRPRQVNGRRRRPR